MLYQNRFDILHNATWQLFKDRLLEVIIPIDPQVLQLREVGKVHRSMLIVVEPKRCINLDINRLLLDTAKAASHEAIIPCIILWYKEISSNLVAQQQLALLTE